MQTSRSEKCKVSKHCKESYLRDELKRNNNLHSENLRVTLGSSLQTASFLQIKKTGPAVYIQQSRRHENLISCNKSEIRTYPVQGNQI